MRKIILALTVILVTLLTGCMGGKQTSVVPVAGEAVTVPQDSLRAKFLLTIVDKDGKPQELDAVLFSVPGKRYRMELTGPLGIGVASMLWTEEGWTMTFPTEKLYMKGAGYMVGLLNDPSMPLVHIHQVADLFNGKLVPENYETLSDSAGIVNAKEPSGRTFSFEKREGHVQWLSRMGRDGSPEILRFTEFKAFEGVETPSQIVFEKGGKRYLEIKIKKVTRNKAFSGGTWRLNVPKSFAPVGG